MGFLSVEGGGDWHPLWYRQTILYLSCFEVTTVHFTWGSIAGWSGWRKWHRSPNDLGWSSHASQLRFACFIFKMTVWLELTEDPHASLYFPARIKMTDIAKCWWGCGENGTLGQLWPFPSPPPRPVCRWGHVTHPHRWHGQEGICHSLTWGS